MNLKPLNKFNEKYSNFIFNLRNKIYVRRNSFNKKIIKIKDHEEWLENFFKKKNVLYVITDKNKFVGYIRLELDKKKYNVSWALEKKFHGKGVAKKFLKKATDRKKITYFAKIKKNNLVSLKVAKSALFEVKTIKNQICYLYKKNK